MTDHEHNFTRAGSIGVYTCKCGASETAMTHVLREGIPAGDPCTEIVGLMCNRRVNTSPGWRYSDAARAEVRFHGEVGCERYREDYERGANIAPEGSYR